MTANSAAKVASAYEDPQDLSSILKHIKDMAKLGFTNTNIYLYVSEDKVDSLYAKLVKLGYDVYLEMDTNNAKATLSLTW
jgi:hypothetical protein